MMCSQCSGFSETIIITEPGAYFSLLDEVLHVLAEGTLELVGGSCDLALIEKGNPWPDDVIEHTFQCSACHRRFGLSVETEGDQGGTWQKV